MKKTLLLIVGMISITTAFCQKNSIYSVRSPDKKIVIKVEAGTQLHWSVTHEAQPIIEPSTIAMDLGKHGIIGKNAKVTSAKITAVNNVIDALNYKKDKIEDHYGQLILSFKG